MVRYTSLPTKVLSLEYIPFDLKFELSLFRSKSKTSLADIVFDPLRLFEVKSLSKLDLSSLKLEENLSFEETKSESDFDKKVWSQFYKLENLGNQLRYQSEKAIIQYQQESIPILTHS